jgi:hypothetical protein
LNLASYLKPIFCAPYFLKTESRRAIDFQECWPILGCQQEPIEDFFLASLAKSRSPPNAYEFSGILCKSALASSL